MPGQSVEKANELHALSAAPNALRSMLRLLRTLLRQAAGQVAVVLTLTLGLIFTSSVSIIMLVPLLGVAGLDVGDGSIGQLSEVVSAALAVIGLAPSLPTVLGAYLVIVVGSAALAHANSLRGARLYQEFVSGLRVRVYEAITACRWSRVVRKPSSSFLHTLTHETERVGGAVSGLLNLAISLFMTVVYLLYALYLSPATTLLAVASGGLLMASLARRTRLGRVKGEAVSTAYEALFGAISEHLAGLRVTKGHGTDSMYLERFRERTQQTVLAQTDIVRNQADVAFWLKVGSAVTMAGVLIVALIVLELPLASVLVLLYLFARLVPNLTGLQRQVQSVLNLLPAVDRVEAMVAWLTEHAEPADIDLEAPSLKHALRLEQVSFGYDGPAGESVLQAVDLQVAAGRTTAIVGPSGGGKSTVADLVVGLLTPDAGHVLVDGVPLEGGLVPAWRRRIGYVNQDTFLFHDTIRANLLLVRPEATEGELRDALGAASATFVETLPEGLDTVVGDRGVRLSGGERQRIALARAILRRPALLVLDEATSALDPENERIIQEAIGRMAGRHTLLVIAHRLASIRAADRIYVMEHGRVVESGSWDELLRHPAGRFREMCLAQGLLDAHDVPDPVQQR